MDNRSIFLAWVGGSAALGSAILIGAVGLALGLLLLIRRAVHAWTARRRAVEDARLNERVDLILRSRTTSEAVTELLPRPTDDESRWFGPYEQAMRPVADLYVFPGPQFPINDGRHHR